MQLSQRERHLFHLAGLLMFDVTTSSDRCIKMASRSRKPRKFSTPGSCAARTADERRKTDVQNGTQAKPTRA
jgi:hypothetical protein